MNIIDYSKALYHLDKLKDSVDRARNNINPEDISIKFLYDCMVERIENEPEKRIRYKNIIDTVFENNYVKFKTDNKLFYVLKNKELSERIKGGSEEYFTEIDNVAVFYTNNGNVYVPENEIDAIQKPYMFLGRYTILIYINKDL